MAGRVARLEIAFLFACVWATPRASVAAETPQFERPSGPFYVYRGGNRHLLYSAGIDAAARPLFFQDPAPKTRTGKELSRNLATALALTQEVLIEVPSLADAKALAHQVGGTDARPVDYALGQFIIHLPGGSDALGAANHLVETGQTPSAIPQFARQRFTRDTPNDPLVSGQWHLGNIGQSGGTLGADLNVKPWWNFAGASRLGAGVNIAVVDDGLQTAHPDLAANYIAALSFDINSGDSDPNPGAIDFHGTAVAGVAAGVGNNGVGITGVAPRSRISGIRLVAAPATDEQEATGLTYRNNNQSGAGTNHIYTNSWGPSDDGFTIEAPGPLTRAAMANAVATGRGGKGSIFVWAAGNGGSADNSNFDGYANSRFAIAVAATTNQGVHPLYSERGANVMVNAPSSGGTLSVTTSDRTSTSGYNSTSGTAGDYTSTFGGTSAAAPAVAGAVALMLEANPNLGWRDVKHILVRTAQQNDPTDPDWTINAAGRKHNDNYGFGRVDVNAAANLAKTWVNVGSEGSATVSKTVNQAIPDGLGGLDPSFGPFLESTIEITQPIKVETVEVAVDVTHPYRGDLEFELVAPTGTSSILGTTREDSGDDFRNWVFTTVRDWDEVSTGLWTLRIHDGFANDAGTLNGWSLSVFGTPVVPEPVSASLVIAGATVFSVRRRRATDFSRLQT